MVLRTTKIPITKFLPTGRQAKLQIISPACRQAGITTLQSPKDFYFFVISVIGILVIIWLLVLGYWVLIPFIKKDIFLL